MPVHHKLTLLWLGCIGLALSTTKMPCLKPIEPSLVEKQQRMCGAQLVAGVVANLESWGLASCSKT
jgi:hypothetical protein